MQMIVLFQIERYATKMYDCEKLMSICLEETNPIFLLSVRQDPFLCRATPAPTPGRFALISKRNNVD